MVVRPRKRQTTRKKAYDKVYLKEKWRFAVIILTSIHSEVAWEAFYAITGLQQRLQIRVETRISKNRFVAFRVTNLSQNSATKAAQDVVPNVPEEDIENKLYMSEVEYIPASPTVYSTPENVQRMIKAVFKVHNETKLYFLIDNTVNKNVHQLFKVAHEKA